MKINLGSPNTHTKTSVVLPKEKKYKEDEKDQEEGSHQSDKKIGVKAIRKILRTLNQDNYPKEEMELMIWVLLI